MNIYQLQQDLLNIFEEIEENEGELTPEIEEKLNITEESFKQKISDYTNVIKLLQADIVQIKSETDRLKSLQKSKEKTINRLEDIMVKAIDLFGDTTKAGGKYVDYGTGKVSIRKAQSVEIDEESINAFVNGYISGLTWYDMQNQLHFNIIDKEGLLNYANDHVDDEDEIKNLNFSNEDIDVINTSVDLKVPLSYLLSSEKGFELAKALIHFGQFKIKGSVDKMEVKRRAKENNTMPVFAKLVDNKSITIK